MIISFCWQSCLHSIYIYNRTHTTEVHYVQLPQKEEALFFIAVHLSRQKRKKVSVEFRVKTNDEFYCERSNILDLS